MPPKRSYKLVGRFESENIGNIFCVRISAAELSSSDIDFEELFLDFFRVDIFDQNTLGFVGHVEPSARVVARYLSDFFEVFLAVLDSVEQGGGGVHESFDHVAFGEIRLKVFLVFDAIIVNVVEALITCAFLRLSVDVVVVLVVEDEV